MGAEIWKIENPIIGDDTRTWGPPFSNPGGESAYFLSINRNKKSIGINIKKKEGLKIIHELVQKCDIVLENFPSGKADQLGVGYEELNKINPKIIYASLTGFGPNGPYKDKLAYDVMVSGIGGLLSVTGPEEGEPVKVGVAITDICAGLFCHGAILAALWNREKTGKGQKIDTSLLEAQVATLANIASNYLVCNQISKPMGTAHTSIVPYQAFQTYNGHIIVGALNDQQFERLCKTLGKPELSQDEHFITNKERVKNRKILLPVLKEIFKKKTTEEWLQELEKSKIPCGPINTMKEVFNDPQVLARGMLQEINHPTIGKLKLTGIPVKFSETKASIRLPPPLLCEHTEEILKNVLGYSNEKILKLKEIEAIGLLT
jgi:succinate--hydroxymethylglutarate CoA-transferase